MVKHVAVLLLMVSVSIAQDLLSKCEVYYRRCTFDCTQRYPLQEQKRKGCMFRCEVDKGLCSVFSATKQIADRVKNFIEGFSQGR